MKSYLTRDKFTVVAVIVMCWFCSKDAFFEWTVEIAPRLLLLCVAHCREAYSVKADECTSKL